MKKTFKSLILCLMIIPCAIFFVGCTKEKEDTPPPEPVNEVKVLLSDDGKTLYRFAPDNDETEYTVPEGITNIGVSAFEDCNNLTKVVLPTTLRYIQEEAFKGCGKLATVEINSDIAIGKESFYNCRQLSTIDISRITTFGLPGMISTIYATEAFYNCDALVSVTIAKEVTHLPEGVFANTNSLTTVNFEANSTLKSILKEAFYESGLTSITLPESCEGIDSRAFAYSDLTSITIGKNITTIASAVFAECDNLSTVEFETGRAEVLEFSYSGDDYSYGRTFSGCSNLVSVTNYPAQSGVLDYMFDNCEKLETFTFADEECDGHSDVYAICKNAFYNCKSLKEIHLPKYIHHISGYAFEDCYSLEEITFAKGMGIIESYAFYNCYSLKEIDLMTISYVDSFAFVSCYSLSKIIIREAYGGVHIDENAFYGCYALFEIYNLDSDFQLTLGEGIAKYARDIYTSLDTPSKIKSVNNVMYYYNGTDFIALAPVDRNVISIEFDSKTTEINQYAFSHCDKLASVTIQESIDKIGSGAFKYNSKSLQTVIINSATIANGLIEASDNGNLMRNATTIYIKTGLTTTNSTYLLENFTKQETSDKTGYDKYVLNMEV